MNLDIDTRNFIKKYADAIRSESAAIFAGAGLSIPSGVVSWSALLEEAAEEIGLDIKEEHDLISLAQYYANKQGRSELNKKMIDEFSKDFSINDSHKILAKLPIKIFWTTNYDTLIEDSLTEANKKPDVKFLKDHLSLNVNDRDAVVYKMHGDKSLANETVLTKNDYEMYSSKRQLFIEHLHTDLLRNTFLFIGFSFDDPNIESILSRIRIFMDETQNKHYCFFKKLKESEYPSREKYLYAKGRMDLKVDDLNRRYKIEAIWVDEYDDIARILKIIYDRVCSNNIFISGAISDFSKYPENIVNNFAYKLANRLAEHKNKIISGFGLGIGSSIINGVLEYVYKQPGRHIEKSLVIRPFPQNIDDDEKRKILWHQYRKDMLSEAGIVIFLFGNKILKDGSVAISDGMMDEYQIAINYGCKVIPLAITDYAAAEIWKKLMDYQNTNHIYKEDIFLKIIEMQKQVLSEDCIEDVIKNLIIVINDIQNSL